MRKNYFEKLVNYMKNVYHIENEIKKLRDGRAALSLPILQTSCFTAIHHSFKYVSNSEKIRTFIRLRFLLKSKQER